MDVNPTKEKKQTNIRSASADEAIRLTPPLLLSLEQALEFIADDECVEVTPKAVRLRKVDPRPAPPGAASAAGPASPGPDPRLPPSGSRDFRPDPATSVRSRQTSLIPASVRGQAAVSG